MASSHFSFKDFLHNTWVRRGFFVFVIIFVFVLGAWVSGNFRSRSISSPYYSYTTDEGSGEFYSESVALESKSVMADSTAGSEDFSSVTPKVIKTGSLSLTVKTTSDTLTAVTAIAASYNGFVQSSNQWVQSDNTDAATVTIRVGSAYFEQALLDLKNLATVVNSESISGQDVTEEYVDLQSRLKNLQAEEEQYLVILNKATTVEDLLNVSDYLARVRGQIEEIQGRLKYLNNRTDYATITISVYEEASVVVPTDDWQPVVVAKQAFNKLVQTGQNTIDSLIWLVIFGIPFLILVWVLYRVGRFFYRRHLK